MTCKDKASYASSPPKSQYNPQIHWRAHFWEFLGGSVELLIQKFSKGYSLLNSLYLMTTEMTFGNFFGVSAKWKCNRKVWIVRSIHCKFDSELIFERFRNCSSGMKSSLRIVWIWLKFFKRQMLALQVLLQHTAAHCNTLQCTAKHSNILNELDWSSSRRACSRCRYVCNTMQHAAIHCNTLQGTATHRKTLQHTTNLIEVPQEAHARVAGTFATHCNTL